MLTSDVTITVTPSAESLNCADLLVSDPESTPMCIMVSISCSVCAIQIP